jgi:mutator protein MutT
LSVPGADRDIVDVAVGVLIERDGRFLLTSRPPGKVYAGWWEFPGGKLESGETVVAALARELHEELGITVLEAEPWHTTRVDYAHARVRLHFCKVLAWRGSRCLSPSRRCFRARFRYSTGLPPSKDSSARRAWHRRWPVH